MPASSNIDDDEKEKNRISLRDRSFSHSDAITKTIYRTTSSSPRVRQDQISSSNECLMMPFLRKYGVKIENHRGFHHRYLLQQQRPRSKSESESARVILHQASDDPIDSPMDKRSGSIPFKKSMKKCPRSNHRHSPVAVLHSTKGRHGRNSGSNISCSSLVYGVLSPKYCYKSRGKMWIRPVLDLATSASPSVSAAIPVPGSAEYAAPSTVTSFDDESIPFLPLFNRSSSSTLLLSSFPSRPSSDSTNNDDDHRQNNRQDVFRLPSFGHGKWNSDNKSMLYSSQSFDEIIKKERRSRQVGICSEMNFSACLSSDSSNRVGAATANVRRIASRFNTVYAFHSSRNTLNSHHHILILFFSSDYSSVPMSKKASSRAPLSSFTEWQSEWYNDCVWSERQTHCTILSLFALISPWQRSV